MLYVILITALPNIISQVGISNFSYPFIQLY